MKIIYADNAATTSVSPKVLESMLPYFTEHFGNPSSIYLVADEPRKAVEKARKQVASCLNAAENEIFFTSGGSESDNWAIKGVSYELAKKNKKHIISSKIEHHAVLHTLESLEKDGFEVTYLDVQTNGMIDLNALESAIKDTTGLVTIMYANNEIGTIQPISKIGEICKKHGIIFHTDAVQAIGNVKIDVKAENIDMLSLSAHKFHGPKGVGALYVRKGIKVKNLIHGGAQEKSKRAGTENVPGIVGLGTAIVDAYQNMDERNQKLIAMRDKFIKEALKIERSRLNGDAVHRLPGNINMCFQGVEGEALILMLNAKGICASSGSACTSGSLDPSHVLLAIGLSHEVAHGSLRLTFSDENTMEDVDYILEVLPGIINTLRNMSPLWEKIIKSEKQD